LVFYPPQPAEIRKSWNILLEKWGHQPTTLSGSLESIYEEQRERRRENFKVLVEEVAKTAGFRGSASFQTCLYRYEYEWGRGLQLILKAVEEEGPLAEIKLQPAALVSMVPFHFFPPSESHKFIIHDRLSHPGDLRVLKRRRLCLYTDPNARPEGISREIVDEIALVPESRQTGDIICGLEGESRNFVLRPITGHEVSKEVGTNQHFALVGMCYRPGRNYSKSACESLILQ
jgi:hypothetical protein